MDLQDDQKAKFCLYARKSSEQDERQALSIDSQLQELLALAEREGLEVVATRKENHSAKTSGSRPEFNRIIADIRDGTFNALLTWAPDRLSRNAGDLGSLVDLMDQGKLVEIRTHGQRFSNSPNEKFLLMILCSQAKLENDNKSVNVKRGLRAKVKMGYRPNMAPLGYLHDKFADKGQKRVYLDPERAPVIKEMFRKVVHEGWTGRRLKFWLDESGATTRKGKQITLSMVYRIIGNHFYTSRYEFPRGSGNWFDGKHDPIVDQNTFDSAQEIMKGTPRNEFIAKEFTFTRLLKCGECGSGVCAQEKKKRLRDGTMKRYVYYGCNMKWKTGCKQTYIREELLMEQVMKMLDEIEIDRFAASENVKIEIEKVKKTAAMLGISDVTDQLSNAVQKFDVRTYAKYILKEGGRDEKRELLDKLKTNFTLKDQKITNLHNMS